MSITTLSLLILVTPTFHQYPKEKYIFDPLFRKGNCFILLAVINTVIIQ